MLAGRGVFTRSFAPEEYGLFSLAFTVTSILSVGAILGLRNGIPRQIAYHGSASSHTSLTPASIVTWGLLATVIASTVIGAGLFVVAEQLAVLFGHPEYALAFRIAAVSLPGFAIVKACTAVFRGFSRAKERVFFQELLQKGTFPLLLVIVVYWQSGLSAALLAFPASLTLTAIAYLCYVFYTNPGEFLGSVTSSLGQPGDGYRLLAFSFPLLFASLMTQIMTWTDILMLGYFKTAGEVGIYDAVRPLVQLIKIIWSSMVFLYTPVVSEFHAQKAMENIRWVYFILTKWFASITFPIALTFLLFPEIVLAVVFGPEYTAGADALRLLAVAFFLSNAMGPNGATLTALGRTRVLMWANLVATIINVTINLWLIPPYGILGAAAATAVALVTRNFIRVSILYSASGIHSFKPPMVVPMAITTVLGGVGYYLGGHVIHAPFHLLSVVAGILVVYGGSMVALGYVDTADRRLLGRIRTGVARVGVRL